MSEEQGQRLFSVAKVGVFVDDYGPAIEKRDGEETKVIQMKLRVQPFDAKLAAALDEGVGGDSNIRATVFSLNTGDPKPNFSRHDFHLNLERQNLELFASPDTEVARIVFHQAKISGTYVREQKDMNAMALCFKATFGPVGRDELEYVHSLHRSQTFITFHESEPMLAHVEEVEDRADENDVAEERPAPMFDDPRDQAEEPPTAREVGARRKLHTGRAGKKGTRKRRQVEPETELEASDTIN